VVNKGRDVFWLLTRLWLLVDGDILHVVGCCQIVFLLEVHFEFSLVMFLHDLVIFNRLLFVHRLVFLNFLSLLRLLKVSAVVLCTHHQGLLLDHFLVEIDLLLEQFNLLSEVFLLHLHRFDVIARSLLNDQVLQAFVLGGCFLAALALVDVVGELATSGLGSFVVNLKSVIRLVCNHVILHQQCILCV
jgi:hypothetical protein